MRVALACLVVLSLGACGQGPRIETIDGFAVRVETDRKGNTIKHIPFRQGTDMIVTFNATRATVTHSKRFPATDGQRRDYVALASRCRAGQFIEQTTRRRAKSDTHTTYALRC